MRTPLFLIPALLLGLAACSSPELTTQPDRVPLGKADALGSCDLGNNGNACGGPAAIGNCWCDDLCEDFGDCCSDKAMLCDLGPDLCDLFSGPCQDDSECGDGFVCGNDPTTCSPSACGCDPGTGSIICTSDCGGNECVPAEEDLCETFEAPCNSNSDCADGSSCIVDTTTCSPSACSCDPSNGNVLCTKDCGGGECVADVIVVCPLILCAPMDLCEFGPLLDDNGCGTCQCAPAPECESGLDCFEEFGPPLIECVGAHWECTSDSVCNQTC